MLSPGRLRHVVRIEQPTTVKDRFGAPLPGWETRWDNVYAEVIPSSAREFNSSAKENSQVTARITLRWREGLRADMRIIHRGIIYNISGLLPDNGSGLEYITIPVTAGVNNG